VRPCPPPAPFRRRPGSDRSASDPHARDEPCHSARDPLPLTPLGPVGSLAREVLAALRAVLVPLVPRVGRSGA
jgi:hypothetical protein